MRFALGRIDALLLLMIFIWGSNFSVVKRVLIEIPELGFNSLRLFLASGLFLVVNTRSGNALSRHDWAWMALLGVIGHFLYQLCFLGGVARTSVANSALILGWTPIAIALTSAALGHERVTALRWVGVLLSAFGIYLVVGGGPSTSASRLGDLLCMGAVAGWTAYTVLSKPLLQRHSAVTVTGYSMAIGTLLYAPLGLPDLRRLDWASVSAGAWAGLAFSAVFALGVAYVIWFRAVQVVGPIRTSVYSNLNPLVAILVSFLWLGEPVTGRQLAGAAAILGGVALTIIEAGGEVGPSDRTSAEPGPR